MVSKRYVIPSMWKRSGLNDQCMDGYTSAIFSIQGSWKNDTENCRRRFVFNQCITNLAKKSVLIYNPPMIRSDCNIENMTNVSTQ